MHVHTLHREQTLDGTPDEVFPFFADAGNLEAITPPWLGFQDVTPRPIEMRAGALLDYRLRLHGVPFGWESQVTTWEPGVRFSDEQRRGPYKYWRHVHLFREESGGATRRSRRQGADVGGRAHARTC